EIVGETGLGSGDDETDENLGIEIPAQKFVSRGLVRGNVSRIGAVRAEASSTSTVTDLQGDVTSFPRTEGATALKPDPEVLYVRTAVIPPLQTAKAKGRSAADRAAEARIRGYEGEACRE